MRRLLSLLLIASVGIPLLPQLALRAEDADLPACCRRDGKHGCGMAKRAATNHATAVRAGVCPDYPIDQGTVAREREDFVLTSGRALPHVPAGERLRDSGRCRQPAGPCATLAARGPPILL